MLSKTMPLPQTQQVTVSATSPPLSPRLVLNFLLFTDTYLWITNNSAKIDSRLKHHLSNGEV